jgi:hypothetical protein
MDLLHRDAAPDHPALPALLARLGSTESIAVPRYPSPGSRHGRCYWNVRDQVRSQGGACLFGWMLLEIPGVALFAWHHAIWRAPVGQLSDISPHPVTGTGVGLTCFAIDPVQDYALDWPLTMPQIFQPLTDLDALDRFIAAEAEVHGLRRRYRDAERAIPSTTCFDGEQDLIIHVESEIDFARLKKLERRYLPRIRAAEERRDALVPALRDFQQSAFGRLVHAEQLMALTSDLLREAEGGAP